jgi:type VI secretion system protein ImpE
VFLPTLYAGSSEHANELVKLGRMTDWKEVAPRLFLAAGLRLWLAEGQEQAILEVRTLEFDPVTAD